MKTQQHTSIEPLESRIAPAGLVISGAPGRTATYTDVDGDIVTVTTSKGIFTPTHFHFGPRNALGGQQLEIFDLLDAGQHSQFNNADITFSAHRGPDGSGGLIGDDSVNLGYLKGSEIRYISPTSDEIIGVDLKTFTLPGDIGKIMLGDAVQSLHQYGITVADYAGVIQVRSLGEMSTSTGAPDLQSKIVANASIFIQNNMKDANLEFFGRWGTGYVQIGGDLIGGDQPDSGAIIWHTSFRDRGAFKIYVSGDVILLRQE